MEGVFNDKVCIYGFGSLAKSILEQLTMFDTNVRRYYLDDAIFDSKQIDENAKIDAVLHSYYKSEVIIMIGNQTNIDRACKIFSDAIDVEKKCLIALIIDDGNDKEIKSIASRTDATIVIPYFYFDILINAGADEDIATEIVLSKTLKSILRVCDKRSESNNTYDTFMIYAKKMGLSTVFFDSIGFDEHVNSRFDFLKAKDNAKIISVVESSEYRSELSSELEKALFTNNKNLTLTYTFYKNKDFNGFSNVTLFVMGY